MYKKEKVNLFDVKDEIINGSLVYTEDSDRGIGKTALMMKMASLIDMPLLVRNKGLAKMLMKSEEFKDVKVYCVADELRGMFRPDDRTGKTYVLVDDITEGQLKDLVKKHPEFTISGLVSKDS